MLDQVFDFVDTPLAHQLMKENKHKGKLGIRIQAPPKRARAARPTGPGAIRAEVGA